MSKFVPEERTMVGRGVLDPPECGASVGRGVLDPPECGASVGRGVPDPPECGASGGRALPCRKRLSHTAPLCVDTRGAIYFITICAADRASAIWVGRGVPDASEPVGRGVPDAPPPASTIISAARHYHEIGKWLLYLILVMPDHLHALISFDGASGTPRPTMATVIAQWKSYVAKKANIRFQRDFWDTRIRDASHFAEQVNYINNNPVRRGLAAMSGDWKWKFGGVP